MSPGFIAVLYSNEFQKIEIYQFKQLLLLFLEWILLSMLVTILADLKNRRITLFWNPKPICSPNKVRMYKLLQNRKYCLSPHVLFCCIGSFGVLGFNYRLFNMNVFMDDDCFSENCSDSKSATCFSP